MMLMLDRGKLVGWSRVRMAGRIDGKEWMVMWIWIVDFGTATGTGRKGGSCQSWVCVRVCVSFSTNSDPSARVNQTINPSNLSNISNTAKARVGLTDVGDFEKCPLYGAGGERRWTGGRFSCPHPVVLCLYLCISSANRREGGGGRWSTGGNCHLGTPVPSAGLL